MKRGLVVLDHTEVPETEWRDRVGRVREWLTAEGIDVALVYGDVSRSDDINYLTNLCIYWNEGMLAIPAGGEPALLTKLSPRVHTWMRRTSTLTDLRSGKAFGALVHDFLDGRVPGTLGLVDGALWPAALVDEVGTAAPEWTVRPLGGVVRALRTRPSERELTQLRRAGFALAQAAGAATVGGVSDRERAALAEAIVRGVGFTDVVISTDEGAVEITGQYRTSWLRVGRGAATDALRRAVGAAAAGVTVAALAELVAPWELRVIDHADLSTNGEYAPHPPDRTLAEGDVVVLSVERPDRLGASDTVLIGPDGAEVLTAQEVRA